MKLNKKRPWLPQEYPQPLPKKDLDGKIAELKNSIARIEREFKPIHARYHKLRKKFAGPISVEMIAARASYDRVRRQQSKLKHRLRVLRLRMKERRAKS
jgi:predicted  nucleic acid-binding Zn-ribbon protein